MNPYGWGGPFNGYTDDAEPDRACGECWLCYHWQTLMVLDAADTAALLLVGLFAGLLGGLAGLGGSILMIPAMSVLFHGRPFDNQHLYQAAAMAVNVAVSVPAAVRHKKSGMIRGDLFRWMLPGTLLFMVAGVLLSNLIDSAVLERVFAVFVAIVAVQTVWAAVKREPEADESRAIVTPGRSFGVGGVMGLCAGVLGVGGGIVAVPLTKVLCRLPLKKCIAVSAAVMGLTSLFGAGLKIATLPEHGIRPVHAVVLALTLAPTAIVGGYMGAGLTKSLPLVVVRSALAGLLIASSLKMLGVW